MRYMQVLPLPSEYTYCNRTLNESHSGPMKKLNRVDEVNFKKKSDKSYPILYSIISLTILPEYFWANYILKTYTKLFLVNSMITTVLISISLFYLSIG
jgi:hypothetical protein